MIIQHGGLKSDSLEYKVAQEWNKGNSLKGVVHKYGNKNKVVWLWKKFHCMVGLGNPTKHHIGKMVDTETADPVWLAHHGYIGAGKKLKEVINA